MPRGLPLAFLPSWRKRFVSLRRLEVQRVDFLSPGVAHRISDPKMCEVFHVEHFVLAILYIKYVCTLEPIPLQAKELRVLWARPSSLTQDMGTNDEVMDVGGSRAGVPTFAKSAKVGQPQVSSSMRLPLRRRGTRLIPRTTWRQVSRLSDRATYHGLARCPSAERSLLIW